MGSKNYNFKATEAALQKKWRQEKRFKTKTDSSDKKCYVLEMFPYPSGRLHVGHLRNYTIGDVIARYKALTGFNVLHPIGWDAFGLPAENAAMANCTHPKTWTYNNIDVMSKQMSMLGLSYDLDLEFASCDPEYYGFGQKIFIEFFKNGLVYRKKSEVNWDPVENTVLANEQVVDGKGWRSGAIAEKKDLEQWFIRTTHFTKDLLKDLDTLDMWPEKVKLMQRNWIGESQGCEINFNITDSPIKSSQQIKIFTTQPDTIFGASFIGLAPDHQLATQLAKHSSAIANFIKECEKTKDDDNREKAGIFTSLYVKHPFANSWQLPVYIANFVLSSYGTGAIFACPAHDERDYEFAGKYNLPIKPVIKGGDGRLPYTEAQGELINSEFLDGLKCAEAKKVAIQKLCDMKQGKAVTTYKLRDWGVSRQRYWGCPIPIIHCATCGPVVVEDLPVIAPLDIDLSKGGNPLANHPTWKYTTCPKCGAKATRDTDTLDTFYESSWYFLHFASKVYGKEILDREAVKYWLPVDYYIGGIEHAILHLLYARFFTKALVYCDFLTKDLQEPFKHLITQGMVCHATYQDKKGNFVPISDVMKTKDGSYIRVSDKTPVTKGSIEKMSKSKHNGIDQSEIIENYGADAARLFVIADSPPTKDMIWTDEGIAGMWRYLNKLWQMLAAFKSNSKNEPIPKEFLQQYNAILRDLTDELNRSALNKYVAKLHEYTNLLNEAQKTNADITEMIKNFLIVLSPATPHIAEKLWDVIGFEGCISKQSWPSYDEKMCTSDRVKVAIQVNGKTKTILELERNLAKEKAQEQALEATKKQLAGKKIKKIIVVPNRIVNIVI